VLADQATRNRTQRLAETMRGYRGAEGAAEALERLVEAGVSAHTLKVETRVARSIGG
jgi:UDP:flavonoid glycosyltransferase YjiC (YdhE family)